MDKNTKKGRPKGSTNRPKTGTNLFVTKFEKQVEGAAIAKDSNMGYIKFGERNNYPQLLLNLYQNSPTHHAACNFAVQSIVGEGIDYNAMGIDGTQLYPNYQYGWGTLIRNIALDYVLYGSYSIQIIKNKDDKTFSFWHIPYEKVRCSPYDEDGQIPYYWICQDWSATGQYTPIQIEAFDMRDESFVERGKPYLYVYKNYDPTMTYYQSPSYAAGIKAIQSEIAYLLFDEKTTVNGFVPSGMLVLNEVETEEERQSIINNITRMFSGVENANSLMISFRRSQDEEIPAFIPFATNTSNVNLFDSANQRTVNRILAAHQINDPQLIGLPNLGGTGFNSEGKLLETAYNVYNKVVGNYNRQCVIKTLNEMFKLNGVDVEIIMKPLSFNLETTETESKSSGVESKDATQDVSTDNIEEKVDGTDE